MAEEELCRVGAGAPLQEKLDADSIMTSLGSWIPGVNWHTLACFQLEYLLPVPQTLQALAAAFSGNPRNHCLVLQQLFLEGYQPWQAP